jgi:MarR family transcriptional regulator for hemolysin
MKKLQPREQFGRLIGEVHRLWRLRMNERLRPLGLSQARWTTLRALSRGGDSMPQTELAASAGVDAPTLVGILDGLVSDGFVSRRASTTDRRVKTVHLTARAKRKLEGIEQVAHTMRLEVTQNIDAASLATAIAALEQVKEQLVETAAQASKSVAKVSRVRPARRDVVTSS